MNELPMNTCCSEPCRVSEYEEATGELVHIVDILEERLDRLTNSLFSAINPSKMSKTGSCGKVDCDKKVVDITSPLVHDVQVMNFRIGNIIERIETLNSSLDL